MSYFLWSIPFVVLFIYGLATKNPEAMFMGVVWLIISLVVTWSSRHRNRNPPPGNI